MKLNILLPVAMAIILTFQVDAAWTLTESRLKTVQSLFHDEGASQAVLRVRAALPALLSGFRMTNGQLTAGSRHRLERCVWTNALSLVVPTGNVSQITCGYEAKRDVMIIMSDFDIVRERASLLELARHVGELRPVPTNDFRARLMATCASDAALRPSRRGAPYYGPNYRREWNRQATIQAQNRYQAMYRRLTLETYVPIVDSVADSMPQPESRAFTDEFAAQARLSDAETAKWFPLLTTQTVNRAASNAVMAPVVR